MKDIIFRVARREDYHPLAQWIVAISQVPQQHCLHSWSGDRADALCQQWLSYLDDSELSYVIAFQEGDIVGAMGGEYDEALGRGWLHGPHATGETWETMAAELFTRLLAELPASIVELNAYLNVENERGRRLYAQRGFKERESQSHEYWLSPSDRVVPGERPYGFLEERHEASFVSLYEALFPTAYYSGERMLSMIGTSHQVFAVAEGNEVLGFAAVSVDESASTGEIQFLGVREDRRGQGYGKRLLLWTTDWLLECAGVSRVCLNVGGDVANARGLYESVGFKLQFTGVGLQKRLAD